MNEPPHVSHILMGILEGFGAGSSSSQSSSSSPRFVGGPSSEYRGNQGTPVYVDGEYRGNGQRIKMSEEEFIKRTVAPPAPPAGQRWWQTTGTPHVINFDDPDVV
jgi:hypothetical protein